MSSTEGGGRFLPCGWSADDILAQVAEGRGTELDAHQLRCPHCQAALGEYDRLWSPVRELTAERVDVPESIVESALRRIRGAVQHTEYGVLESVDGVTRVSARVVVVAARVSAQGVAGVRVALSRHIAEAPDSIDASADPRVTAGVAGRSTAIEITLAADYGLNLHELAERVRQEVASRVRTLTDLEPVLITVIIDDVLP